MDKSEYGTVASTEVDVNEKAGSINGDSQCVCPLYGERWGTHTTLGQAVRVGFGVIAVLAGLFGIPALFLDFFYHHRHRIDWYATFVSGIFTVLTLPISIFQVHAHMSVSADNSEMHHTSKYIIRVLGMVPFFAAWSFCTVYLVADSNPDNNGLAFIPETLIHWYEAFTVYSFFKFLVKSMEEQAENYNDFLPEGSHKHPFPLTLCCKDWDYKGGEFVESCRKGMYGFMAWTVLLPFVKALFYLIEYAAGSSLPAEVELLFSTLCGLGTFLASSWGLWCLFNLVHEAGLHGGPLAPADPFPKFYAIKGVVFITTWQALALHVFFAWYFTVKVPTSDDEHATLATELSSGTLMCVEMFFFAIVHWYAFPPPKRDPGARVNIRKNVPKLFAQESVINDTVPIIREVAQLGREVAQTWITIALTVWWVILLLVGILVAVVVVKRSDM